MVKYQTGEPCSHIGCERHTTHPCEECGRVNARGIVNLRSYSSTVERLPYKRLMAGSIPPRSTKFNV